MLPVDFQDDILAESMNGRRKYQMITNSDGTVSFVDVTEYKQVGSNFGQAQVNATNEAVNESADKNKIIDDKDDLVANSQAGMIAGALAVKAIREELNQNMKKIPLIASSGTAGATKSISTIVQECVANGSGLYMFLYGYDADDSPDANSGSGLCLVHNSSYWITLAFPYHNNNIWKKTNDGSWGKVSA